jgi:hypothetical protein
LKLGSAISSRMTSLRRGIGRLIDSYTEGVIDKTDFEPRIAALKQRLSQLQQRHQAALEAAETERDLALVISRLEDFSAKVITGLDNLDRFGMQDIIRSVVRRIQIDDSCIEVIFRVPSPDVHRDQDHRLKRPVLGNIVQALLERTFAWISRNRRVARDFERYARTVSAFIRLAMIRIMLRRIAATAFHESKLPGWALRFQSTLFPHNDTNC